MNVFLGRYDIDASPQRKRWLRNTFVFQTKPISDPDSSDVGMYLGMDEASIQEAELHGGEIDGALMILVTPALRDEFRDSGGPQFEVTPL